MSNRAAYSSAHENNSCAVDIMVGVPPTHLSAPILAMSNTGSHPKRAIKPGKILSLFSNSCTARRLYCSNTSMGDREPRLSLLPSKHSSSEATPDPHAHIQARKPHAPSIMLFRRYTGHSRCVRMGGRVWTVASCTTKAMPSRTAAEGSTAGAMCSASAATAAASVTTGLNNESSTCRDKKVMMKCHVAVHLAHTLAHTPTTVAITSHVRKTPVGLLHEADASIHCATRTLDALCENSRKA